MVSFSPKELAFIQSNEVCRLATTSKDGLPHVVPVNYIFLDGYFYVATDYDTKKFSNVKENNRVALLVDTVKPNRAVLIEGVAHIVERGPEFRRVYPIFHKKFDWVRAEPWSEGEAPFLRIRPLNKVSWGSAPGREQKIGL